MDQQLIEAISESVVTLTLDRPDRLDALSTTIMEGVLVGNPIPSEPARIG